MFLKSIILFLSIGFLSSLLTACGGGGGGNATTQTFNPRDQKTFLVPDSIASVAIDADTLVKVSDSSLPVGNVDVTIEVLNPAININALPGKLTFKNANGDLLAFESYGAMSIDFNDSEGSVLKLLSGSTATLHIPLINKSATSPNTIQLYYYDETESVWVEGGDAVLQEDVTTGQQFYAGDIDNLSIWTAGSAYSEITISGCVEDGSATPLPLSGVTIFADGNNYSGKNELVTGSDGLYSISVKQKADVLIYGELNGVKTNTMKLTTTDVDLDTTISCLSFAKGLGAPEGENASISIKAKWGNFPEDLDVRLTGPNGLNVFFNDRGALLESPFIRLDAIDDDAYGPEVLTIFKFENPGVYRFIVSHFKTSNNVPDFSITNSPTQVELNVNGVITTFVPPEGEANNLIWNVFEFIVGSDGSFTVNPVNTWSLIFSGNNS